MEISTKERKRTIRNLVIFTVVSLSCGFVGIALDRLSPPQDPMQGLGALVWLVSPLAANLLLRLAGGDGWKDFGIRPNLRSGWVMVSGCLAPGAARHHRPPGAGRGFRGGLPRWLCRNRCWVHTCPWWARSLSASWSRISLKNLPGVVTSPPASRRSGCTLSPIHSSPASSGLAGTSRTTYTS